MCEEAEEVVRSVKNLFTAWLYNFSFIFCQLNKFSYVGENYLLTAVVPNVITLGGKYFHNELTFSHFVVLYQLAKVMVFRIEST